jgi:hypothetical protein
LSTAWIYDGYESALEELGIEVMPVRLDNLISTASEFIEAKRSLFEGDQGASLEQWKMHLSQQLAIPRILECVVGGSDVLLNICGKLWSPQNAGLLDLTPFNKVVMLTESPYEDDSQIHIMQHHDFAFTNDKSSAVPLSAYRPTAYLRHAYDPDVFRYIEIERKHKYDYSFIGTPFGNRMRILKECAKLPLEAYVFNKVIDVIDEKDVIAYVPPESACRIYNQTKVNLNIHRGEKYYGRPEEIDAGSAYSLGPRAFEIAGCRAFQLCDSTRPELMEVFGETVATYDQPECVAEAISYWADDARTKLRRDMAKASQEIALNNTYLHRAAQLVEQLAQWYNRADWLEGLQDG